MPNQDGTGPMWQRHGRAWRKCLATPETKKQQIVEQLESIEQMRINLQKRLDDLHVPS